MPGVTDTCITQVAHFENDPFYSELDGTLIPGPLTGGPWDTSIQHGGPISGILAHPVEQVSSPVPMRTGRYTVDMMRAVPLTPLRGEVEVVRSGYRIQVIRASLIDEQEREVARSTSLRMRLSEVVHPLDPERTAHEEDLPHPMPAEPVAFTIFGVGAPEFLKAVEFRRESDYRAGALGLLWLRMHNTQCEGSETSNFVRLATLSDMTLLAAQYLDAESWMTVTAFRDPAGDWSDTRSLHKNDVDGIGLSETVLYDLSGRVGRATASILISPR